ncbi:formate dehydrogenase accessory protein FdhE [Stutzerimonas urumqiensis]|uniref:formate dehydrogenase accessory protein FdhE n=1 Tax=Stutzerimonas urumqiensis TaxID=638269 RepID=UPI003BAB4B2F
MKGVNHSFGSAPSGIMEPPEVLLPQPDIFARRALRMRELAERVPPLADFLTFMARAVQAQQQVLDEREPAWRPAPGAFDVALEHGMPPLSAASLRRDLDWRADLTALLDALELHVAERQRPLLEALRAKTDDQLEELAELILEIKPGTDADRGLLPFVAAAMQVAWARLALSLPRPPKRPTGAARSLCPCCGSQPVASVVHFERDRQGVRYLHCSLCETEWHLERVTCSVCHKSGQLHYFGLDEAEGKLALPAQAEACKHCNSYLKIVPREFNASAEPLADDLASLALDLMLDEQGTYARNGYNPLLIAG